MPKPLKIKPHPRLYLNAKRWKRVNEPEGIPLLLDAAKKVKKAAGRFLSSVTFPYNETGHNAHLIRARIMQGRVVTLLTCWKMTGQQKYREAALRHLLAMGHWKYWSWITWRQSNSDPKAIFDLSYGENSATLALGYDLLHDTLTPKERSSLLAIIRERSLKPFLHNTEKKRLSWWFGKPDTNWNTVCAGGAGMLAMAVYEDLKEARSVLRRAEESIQPFMKEITAFDGGWPEGIGYWNYGMRYAYMYLLSYESATGRRHPLLKAPAVKKSMDFPLALCPNGVPCSFGDVNQWQPLPFHMAAAERLQRPDVLATLVERVTLPPAQNGWPQAAELLVLHPREVKPGGSSRGVFAHRYRGLDWAILADRALDPTLFCSIRGGTTSVPHSHLDLLSFHCVVKDEALITNLGGSEYLDSTFSPRRFELYEMRADSKNTILINGLGIANPATVKTTTLKIGKSPGFRLDASDCFGIMRDGPVAKFCARLFLILDGQAILIVDRMEVKQYARLESRLHSFADVTTGPSQALLKGERQRMRATFASSVPAALYTGVSTPTTPGKGVNILRWCSRTLHNSITFATLLTPGSSRSGLRLSEGNRGLTLRAHFKNRTRTIRLTNRLMSANKQS